MAAARDEVRAGRRKRARSRRRSAAPGCQASTRLRAPRRCAARARSPPGAGTRAFFWLESFSVTRHSVRAIASGMPGRPAPVPTSASARPRHRQMRQHGERVEQVVAHHLQRIANRGQVVGPVPLREQREIRRAAVPAASGRQAPAPVRPSPRSSAARGVMPTSSACGEKPRFRCTSSSEIAAGVMPEMRAAWPMVSGRWRSASAALRSTARALRGSRGPAAGAATLALLAALDFLALALDVALVLRLDLDLLGDCGIRLPGLVDATASR